jgi:hypothetical protein
MDNEQFWALIETARSQTSDPSDADTIASSAAVLLATYPRDAIVAGQQIFWDLMADSYRNPLWAAAYLINGGCSDDGFDYFRGWLIMQGRVVFERTVAEPDALAELPAVRAAAADGMEFECEAALGIATDAHVKATGEQLPDDAYTINYPELGDDWNFDFDDDAEMARRLPRLTALYAE